MVTLNRINAEGLTLPLPVPAGAESGKPTLLGANGLWGVLMTARATTAEITAGRAAPGLKDGEGSVYFPFCHMTIKGKFPAAGPAQFDKIYMTPAGVYTGTASGNTFVGYLVSAAITAVDQEGIILLHPKT